MFAGLSYFTTGVLGEGGLECGCVAQPSFTYNGLTAPNRGRLGHPGGGEYSYVLLKQKIVTAEAARFKFTRNPEVAPPPEL